MEIGTDRGNCLDCSSKGLFCGRIVVKVNSQNFQDWTPDFTGNIFLQAGEGELRNAPSKVIHILWRKGH